MTGVDPTRSLKSQSTDRLIDQAGQYLDSVRSHRVRCPEDSVRGRRPGCTQYHNLKGSPHPRFSCAEDLSFLYTELGRIYTILAERE